MLDLKPFYNEGLSFSCTRCSACCRHESGFVFLSETDVSSLAAEFKLPVERFIKAYCRWVPSKENTERLSLREKSNFDCIFWDSGCKVYNSRPLQCKTFPFWPNVLNLEESWTWTGENCPGINKGKLHNMKEIEKILVSQALKPIITRKSLIMRGS